MISAKRAKGIGALLIQVNEDTFDDLHSVAFGECGLGELSKAT